MFKITVCLGLRLVKVKIEHVQNIDNSIIYSTPAPELISVEPL
jgi:hypothetical protein